MVVGVPQVADAAIPVVAAGTATARRGLRAGEAVATVHQDIPAAAGLPADRAFPVEAAVMGAAGVMAGKASPAAAAIMVAGVGT